MKTNKVPVLVVITSVVEWLAVALVFAFVFRGFVVEAFKIPTGSMAPTLRGDHFEVACVECGYQYDVGYTPGNPQQRSLVYTCPSCGHRQVMFTEPSGGDRILVYKSLYNFKDPKRWDVFVFKNPTEPQINYIKRTIGLPGETLELIDGDLFVDGNIARKPAKVQEEMWMPIYDGDYIPSRPQSRDFKSGKWKVPFVMDTGWTYEDGGATFTLNSKEQTMLTYDINIGNDLRATYGYNASMFNRGATECSDFRIKFWVDGINKESMVGARFYKYGRIYTAKVDFEKGLLQLFDSHGGKEQLLDELAISSDYPEKPVMFEFNNADYRLSVNFGKYSLVKDIGTSYGDIGTYSDGDPVVEVCGKGKLAINHLLLERDIHYVSRSFNRKIRAGEGNPITLGEDEFFACGDNSPASLDSRLWEHAGIGNAGKVYPMGVVPRDYLIGQAFFVYWPGSYKSTPRGKGIKFIPNAGMMRWIYGGEDVEQLTVNSEQ